MLLGNLLTLYIVPNYNKSSVSWVVEAKYVVIAAGVIGAGAVGIIVLYQLMKGGQLVMPSFQPTAYQAQAQTTQQACAAKGWVWEAGSCKQYPSSGEHRGGGKDDKV